MHSEFEGISTAVIDRENTLTLLAVHLVVVDGPDAGKKLRVAEQVARIGTAKGNHLVLSDPTVSRQHCEIRVTKDGVRLVDAGSTNGTFVDRVRVRDADLVAGTTVELGATRIRVELSDEAVHVPLSTQDRFGPILGSSVEMRRVYAMLERAAPTEATVLLQGETGTGKELVARALHDASARAKGPFLTFDCGALAPTLVESELFGHQRGAFTGATTDRKGVFEEARGGTLFIDELGELPLSLQPKLLRALESRQIRRLGSNAVLPIDVRIVAATHRSLSRMINEGGFREDLYYRLAVVEIELPPLRARREDIAILAKDFHTRFSGSDAPIPPDLLAAALSREWPGNVRELRNFIERSVSIGWSPSDSPATSSADRAVHADVPFKDARRAWTRAYVTDLLGRADGNVTKAAEIAGLSRRFLQRMLARLERQTDEDDDD